MAALSLAKAAEKGDMVAVRKLLLRRVCEQIDANPSAVALAALCRRAEALVDEITKHENPAKPSKAKGGDDLASRRAARAAESGARS